MAREPDMVVRLVGDGEQADQVVGVVGDQVLTATPSDVGKVVTVAADGSLVLAAGGGLAQLGETIYNPGALASYAAGSTMADVDATNLAVSFAVPASGKVTIVVTARVLSNSQEYHWGLRDGATDVAGSSVQAFYSVDVAAFRFVYRVRFTGLTPGEAKTWKLAHKSLGAGASIEAGGTSGQALMQVFS